MQTPNNVKLSLYRRAAIPPYTCLVLTVLAGSKLEALNRAKTEMNVVVDDDEYAAATEAKPVWGVDPRTPAAKRALALAA